MNAPRFYATQSLLPKGCTKIDTLKSAYGELFFIEHPEISKSDPRAKALRQRFLAETPLKGTWVYYPWARTAVHIPPEDIYFRLRTARNRDLILDDEQQKYRAATVGVAGLSVGSAVVMALVATGGPKYMKIADPDHIEITNLNRMRATVLDVGRNKAQVIAEQAWEVDPYAKIEVWNEGIRTTDLKHFFSEKPALDIFVDEMDDIAMKIAARRECQHARIPVVMATDNGDSIIVDVERFDHEPKRPLFHGNVTLPKNIATLTRSEFIALSTHIIDPTFFTVRQQKSILAIGTRLAGIAQIATAATIAGAAVSYVVRQIATGAPLPSGRYVMGCEPTFTPGYATARQKAVRRKQTELFLKALANGKQ